MPPTDTPTRWAATPAAAARSGPPRWPWRAWHGPSTHQRWCHWGSRRSAGTSKQRARRHRDHVGGWLGCGMTPGRPSSWRAPVTRRAAVHQFLRPTPSGRPRCGCRCRRAGVGHRPARRPRLRPHLAGPLPRRRRPRAVAPAHHWNDPQLARPASVRGRCPAPPACTPSSPAWSAASPVGPPQRCGTLPGRAAGHRPGHPRPAKHAGAVWAGNRELRLLTIGAYRDLLRRDLADDLVEERRSELLVVVDVDVQRVTDRQPEGRRRTASSAGGLRH
jgi:hypothetical protein